MSVAKGIGAEVNPPVNSEGKKRTDSQWPRIGYQTIPWTDLFNMEQTLARKGVHLTGLNIKADEDGWFVIIKAVKNGQKVVHFTGGRHWMDALEVIGWEVGHHELKWRPDKY